MCGRYTLIHGETAQQRFSFHDWHERVITPRFNIAPGQAIMAVQQDVDGRHGVPTLWGFHPSWMKAGKGPPPINAKAETLLERPMWKGALRRGRVLVPADGFYEWQATPGRKAKRPMHIRLRGGELFGLAALSATDLDGNPTCAIVTTGPNELMRPIHDRMPVILDPEDEELWLDPDVPADVALGCLRAYPAERMEAYPVGPGVGNVRNDTPDLVEPLAAEAAD